MSTFISVVHAAALNFSVVSALKLALAGVVTGALLVLFKPLLRGVGRALVLVVRPRLSKEQRLQRRQMRDVVLLNRMLHATDADHSHATELRALAARA